MFFVGCSGKASLPLLIWTKNLLKPTTPTTSSGSQHFACLTIGVFQPRHFSGVQAGGLEVGVLSRFVFCYTVGRGSPDFCNRERERIL